MLCMTTTHTCPRCERELDASLFHKAVNRPSGLNTYCKECVRARKAGEPTTPRRRKNPATATEKRCPICEVTKPVDDFHRNTATPDRRQAYCKPCMNARYDPEYAKAYQARRLADPEKKLMHQKAVRRRMLERNYGITPEDYDRMLAEQGGTCGICDGPQKKVNGTDSAYYAVDHCHATGKVRGLLCNGCNLLLHKLDTHPGWIERALDYLKKAAS